MISGNLIGISYVCKIFKSRGCIALSKASKLMQAVMGFTF